jgi:hypothetical protein
VGANSDRQRGTLADSPHWRVIALVFLPFAFGYYLSYVFRTINALSIVVQYSIGLVVEHWSPHAGHYPVIAYKIAFGLNIILQLATLAWFLRPSTEYGLANASST